MKKVLAFFLAVLTLATALAACVSTRTYESTDDYLRTDVPVTYSEHAIFPDKEMLADTTVELYRSESQSTLLFDDIYFLLKCTYSQEPFQQEIKRIEELGAEYEETHFLYPAYVMLFHSDRYYEYALVDIENCSIVYVSAEVSNWKTFSDIPSEYLPVTQENLDICVYEY